MADDTADGSEAGSVPDMHQLHDAAKRFLELLEERKAKVATAESCTGGFVASMLTDIEGLSHSFDRAYICYSVPAKIEMLGLDPAMIDENGTVSEPVARALAENALAKSQADIAIGVTGFAGKSDPDEDEGDGVVYVGVATTGETRVERFDHGQQSREDISKKVVMAALNLGIEMLEA